MRSMTKLAGLALAASMLVSPVYASENRVTFDFERDDGGFTPIYADYPGGEGVEEFYELRHGHEKVPIDGEGKGLFLSGSNHSDDLFMGYYKELTGFRPGQLYAFHVTFRLATQVDGGMIGVGGSPGASVYVKGGVAMEKPERVQDELGYYRLNLDKANQGQGGTDLALLGNLEKSETLRPGKYEWKEFSFDAQARADAGGRLWLVLGTDSGFEAVSSYYLDDISLSWAEAADELVTRGGAVRRMYDDLRPAGEDAPDFTDVGESSPYWDALGWAQKNGLVSGYGGGVFGPEDPLTVEQAAVILYRYAGSPSVEWDGVPIEASDWAEEAVAWGIENDLISETDGANGGKPMDEFAFTRAWRRVHTAQADAGPALRTASHRFSASCRDGYTPLKDLRDASALTEREADIRNYLLEHPEHIAAMSCQEWGGAVAAHQLEGAWDEDGKGLELNTSSHRYGLTDSMPSTELLRLYRDLGGSIVTIGSDSHSPAHLGAYLQEAQNQLSTLGFQHFCTFEKMQPIFR